MKVYSVCRVEDDYSTPVKLFRNKADAEALAEEFNKQDRDVCYLCWKVRAVTVY